MPVYALGVHECVHERVHECVQPLASQKGLEQHCPKEMPAM